MNILRKHFRFNLQHPVFVVFCSLVISVAPASLQATDRTSADTAKNSPLEQCYNTAKLPQAGAAQLVAGVRACTQALRYAPMGKKSRAQVYLHRGVLHKKSLNPDLALRDFYRAKRAAGDSPALSINIGNAYYLKRDFYRAIGAYDSALAMNFSAPQKALLNRGLANERLGRRQEAINAYAKALAFEPAMATAQERLQVLTRAAAALAFSKQPNEVTPASYRQHSQAPLARTSQPQGTPINNVPMRHALIHDTTMHDAAMHDPDIDIVALAVR